MVEGAVIAVKNHHPQDHQDPREHEREDHGAPEEALAGKSKAAEKIGARQGQQQAEACAVQGLPAGEGKGVPKEFRLEKTGQLLQETGAKENPGQHSKDRQVKEEKQDKVDRVPIRAPFFPRE